MKKYGIAIIVLGLFAEVVLGAPGQLDIGTSTWIKRVRGGFDNPVDLFVGAGTGNDTDNKLFTSRTIARLGPDGLADFDQKRLRNEACASFAIYTGTPLGVAAVAVPVGGIAQVGSSKWMPGSLGIYLNGESIVSASDQGLSGESLSSVLRKLKDRPAAEKVFAAKYYAVSMAKNLEIIHAGNIIWNNADLNNFYVRPEGTLYAADFSQAQNAVAPGANTAVLKANEWRNLIVNVIPQMYNLLFSPTQANTEVAAMLQVAAGPAAAAPSWRTFAWDAAQFIATLDANLLGGYDLTPEVPMAGGLQDAGTAGGAAAGGYAGAGGLNAIYFLQRENNIPYKPSANGILNIARDNQVSAQNIPLNPGFLGDNEFAISAAVMPLTRIGNTALPYTQLNDMCNGWTGNE